MLLIPYVENSMTFMQMTVWKYLHQHVYNYKGKDSNFTVAKPTLSKWSRSTSPTIIHMDIINPMVIIMHWEGHIISVVFLPKSFISVRSRENIRQIQTEGHLTKQLISTPQKCQGYKRQRNTETQRECRRLRKRNT